jgi:hypothetical protein
MGLRPTGWVDAEMSNTYDVDLGIFGRNLVKSNQFAPQEFAV